MQAAKSSTRGGQRTIYVVRHAIAAERSDKFKDDSKRPLTRDGIKRMRQGVRGFRALDPEIELVLTSPLVRAQETADILASGLSPSPDVEVLDALTPGTEPAAVAARLKAHRGRRVIALVGHEPDLGVLAAWLIGAREPLVFKKGGIARIDVASFPPGSDGQLVWSATPKMLRALAGHR